MNWKFKKYKWLISWYNIDNEPEDSYAKKYNDIRNREINNNGKYWKKIFNFRYFVKYKQDYGNGHMYEETEYVGLQYINEFSSTSITWIGKYKIYRLYLRYAPTYKEKAKWCLKYSSWRNDHVSGG